VLLFYRLFGLAVWTLYLFIATYPSSV